MRGFLFLFLRPGSTTSAQLSRCWNITNQHNKPLFRPEHAGFLGVGRRSLLGGWGAFPLGFSVGMGQLLEGWDKSTWPWGPGGCGKWREGWMPHGNRGQSLCPRSPGLMATEAASIRASAAYGVCRRTTHLCFPQETGAVEGLGAKVVVPPLPAEWLRAVLGLRDSTTLAAPLACGAWGGRPSLPFVSSPTRLLLAFDGDSCGHCYSSCQLESRRGWAGSMCWIPGVMGAGGYPHLLQPLSSSDPTSIRRGPGFGFQNTQWPLSGSVGKGSPSQPRQATAQGRREN